MENSIYVKNIDYLDNSQPNSKLSAVQRLHINGFLGA